MSNDYLIGGQKPETRLMEQVIRNGWAGNPPDEAPTPLQASYVLRGLADHTAILSALDFSGSDDPATNIGRWFHYMADVLERSTREHRNA